MSIKINGTNSGSVTLDAPASGSDVLLTLPGGTGTNGQLLSTNGSGVLSFVNGGKILQVVRATDTTSRSTTSTSFVDATGMSVTITPTKSTSAILLLLSARVACSHSSDTDLRMYIQWTDSSNNTISGAETTQTGVANMSTAANPRYATHISLFGYATPATTSSVTYKIRHRVENASCTGEFTNHLNTAQMFAIEVAA